MELAEYMAIPYIAVIYSIETPEGTWVRRAEYPELPGCVAEASNVLDAMDQLEELRIRLVAQAYHRGEEIPVPRPPLKSGVSGLSASPVGRILHDLVPGAAEVR